MFHHHASTVAQNRQTRHLPLESFLFVCLFVFFAFFFFMFLVAIVKEIETGFLMIAVCSQTATKSYTLNF